MSTDTQVRPQPITAAARSRPPTDTEIEISLFGPGFGECVVLHVGKGEWVIIDSCIAESDTPAAIEYLRLIGVDCATAVSHLIISHADNDHIGGAARLFAVCESARLVYSAAFAERDVSAWIAAYSDVDASELSRASTEIAEIISSLPNRAHKDARHAQLDLPILQNELCRLTALSPNDARIEQFVRKLVLQLPEAGLPRRRPNYPTPNQACVALLLETPFVTAILGADLEEVPGKAWSHIIENSIAYGNSQPAILLKVPHHGSKNADCEGIWKRLAQPPIAILATWSPGDKLPQPADVTRILGRTDQAYSCSSFARVAAPRDSDIDKFLGIFDVKRTRRFPVPGHIRTRFREGAPGVIELFGNAVHLEHVY